MVLDQGLVDAAMWGDPETIWDWLQSLDRPEDINEVDARGRTVLSRERPLLLAPGNAIYRGATAGHGPAAVPTASRSGGGKGPNVLRLRP